MWATLFGSWEAPAIVPVEDEPSVLTPPSSSEPTAAIEVPSLPLELIIVIIQATLPPPSYDSFILRSAQLRSYSLVSRDWHSIAQPELFAHVVLSTGGMRADQLVRSIEYNVGLRNLVRSIRLGGGEQKVLGKGEMGALLDACECVEELLISGWANCDLAWLMKGQSKLMKISDVTQS